MPVLSEAEVLARQERDAMKRRASAIERLVMEAGPRLAKCRLSNFDAKSDYQKKVVSTLVEWSESFAERQRLCQGIVLYGPVGTGKDHLLFSVVGRVVHATGVSAKWVNGRELVGTIRDRIAQEASERSLIAEMTSPDILVISDPLPPIGDLTQHQADMLYRICQARYGLDKMTMATLNVASDEEADRRLGVATWDRLCHGAWKIACMWGSYRKPALDMRP